MPRNYRISKFLKTHNKSIKMKKVKKIQSCLIWEMFFLKDSLPIFSVINGENLSSFTAFHIVNSVQFSKVWKTFSPFLFFEAEGKKIFFPRKKK